MSSIGDISAKLLQKIEELTLYVIELKKENETITKRLAELQKRIDATKRPFKKGSGR